MSSVLLSFLGLFLCSGIDSVELRFSPAVGSTLHYVRTQDRTNQMELDDGRKIKVHDVRTLEMTLVVDAMREGGGTQVTQRIDRVMLKRDMPGRPVQEFDSDKPDAPISVSGLNGATFSFTLKEDGQVEDLEISRETKEHIVELPAAAARVFNADSLRLLIPVLGLARGKINKGARWETKVSFEDQNGRRNLDTEYKYEGQDRDNLDIARITGDVKITLVPSDNSPSRVDLRSASQKESVLIDVRRGVLKLREIDEVMDMVMTIQGRKIHSKISGRVTWKLK